MHRKTLSFFASFLCSFATCAIWLAWPAIASAQNLQGVVIFQEAGFPAADSAVPSREQLETILPGAHSANSVELGTSLNDSATRVLILPYGSAFPEEAWGPVFAFLQRGGNLVVLGGRPFTRAAYRDNGGWHLRDYSVRFARQLMIDQYEPTPGSADLSFQTNPDVTLQPKAFSWKRAFSPVIRLSAVDLYNRGGSAGSIDARLDALAWGVKDGRILSAPMIQVDHLRNGFDKGRWIFVNSEVTPEFYSSAETQQLTRNLVERALQGSEEFTVRPVLPLYLQGEPVQLDVAWHPATEPSGKLTLKVSVYPEDTPSKRSTTTKTLPSSEAFVLPTPAEKGFHVIEAELLEGTTLRAVYRSGFWIRDDAFLKSGPTLSVNRDYFELDGKSLAVIGTTYMSSEVQRLFFEHPNAYVWNRDLRQIHDAGLNMIRTGWWSAWDKLCDENGQPYDRTLRTIEAYLMSARKYGLPVQFNFFAFLPDVLGGVNSYLDPEAVRRQQTLVLSVVARFKDVPFLAWDLINEPSISKRLWTMRPNDDYIENAKWNEWLNKRYPDRATLAAAWNVPPGSVQGSIPLPQEIDFSPRGMYVGRSSIKTYDYYLFAQSVFASWAAEMRERIRATGSQQLITVGQDEGGFVDRPNPAFFGGAVDFTTNHSWWQNDDLLWDSLVAKQPGKAMLIQETGLQRELTLDEVARRSLDSEANLLERKIATSFVQGSGAIEWLWNTNSYMTEGNETPIGAVWPDGVEKTEAGILRAYATFAKAVREHLKEPRPAPIAIVTSQAAQFSALQNLQIEAQRKAVRALNYGTHLTSYVIAENQIEKLGSPKLAILPSAQALTDAAWQTLLRYVSGGGNLLITGPVEHNEHWQSVSRLAELKIEGSTEPLVYHDATIRWGGHTIALTFDQQKQFWLDNLRFRDGSTIADITFGKGRIFWCAYPVELAEGTAPATELYAAVAAKIGLKSAYESLAALSSGVLVYPTVLQDSVLYVLVSDSAEDTPIDLRDIATGVRLTLKLSAQHVAIAVLSKETKNIVAKYGF